MSRLIIPGEKKPEAGDVQMCAEQGVVLIRQCLVITQAFSPDEGERFAYGMLKTVELARQQAAAAQAALAENGIGI